METVGLRAHRAERGVAAIVFVHGFASRGNPFGALPELLASNPRLDGWDIFSLRYSTGLAPDIQGIWEADPSIEVLSTYLRSSLAIPPVNAYDAIAIVAHSMGGLVVQRALLDDEQLADRTSHVFMFGTPSAGVRLARWAGFFKSQIEDMAEGGRFIAQLRQEWDKAFGAQRPFGLRVIAGDRDAFVPARSSLDPFPEDVQVVLPGDHLELVGASGPGSRCSHLVADVLAGDDCPEGQWNSARRAVETSEFDRAIRVLAPNAAELDQMHLATLALALDATGRRDEAIDVLRTHASRSDTDARGVLAGRLKRAWLASGRSEPGREAKILYAEALEIAEAAGDDEQIYYHAINCAFLSLLVDRDRAGAQTAATRAKRAAEASPVSYWSRATEAEALLYLERPDEALEVYRAALHLEPGFHEMQSTLDQAITVCSATGRRDLVRRLRGLFGGSTA